MLNREEILIKIAQIFDVDMKTINLKQSSQKERFKTLEESSKKFQEHLYLLYKELNFDDANPKLLDIFKDLLYLYEQIEMKLLYRLDEKYEKKLNWILLKRLVVPYLAYRFANLDTDYNNRIDKNMSGGDFWYLPDLPKRNKIKMPVEKLMKWWLDLYGKGLDSLCNEIDEDSLENQAFVSKNILNPWLYKGILPDRRTLKSYLNKNIIYRGIFQKNQVNKVSLEFERVKKFLKNKGLTSEILKDEIPEATLIDKIFETKNSILKREKKYFIQLISERWVEPNKESLISKFLIARAVQDVYNKLIKYFDIPKDSIDIEENKVLQLNYQYRILYNIGIDQNNNPSLLQEVDKNIAYEYLGAFNGNNFENIIKTISSDINIELNSPLVSQYELEDIYKTNFLFAHEYENEKLFEKSMIKDKKFENYFHHKYDNYVAKIKEYRSLNNQKFTLKLKDENNFELLSFLFASYEHKNYEKEEKICFQMSKLAKDSKEELQVLSCFIKIYILIHIEENIDKELMAKSYIEIYLKLLNEDALLKDTQLDILFFQISFYLKSKNFEKSLIFCNEYFNTFINKQKKEDSDFLIVYLGAYCAYTCKNEKELKKYNNFLEKHGNVKFKNQESLPLPIYFYK